MQLRKTHLFRAVSDSVSQMICVAPPAQWPPIPPVPSGCRAPGDTDRCKGWPVQPICRCNLSSAFRFHEHSPLQWDSVVLTDNRQKRVTNGNYKHIPVSGIYCDFTDVSVGSMLHPGDAITSLWPCWSMYEEFCSRAQLRKRVRFFIVSEDLSKLNHSTAPWLITMMSIMNATAVGNFPAVKTQHNTVFVKYDWAKHGRTNGWHFPTKVGQSSTRGMKQYFLRKAHANSLRDAARQSDSRLAYPSTHLRPNVLMLNRKGQREIVRSSEVIRQITSRFGVAVKETHDMGSLSPRDQIALVHEHDIIISPHGQQLSTIGFARECTAVLEVYVPQFAIPGFFLPWAVNADLLAFGLYSGERLEETSEWLSSKGLKQRSIARRRQVSLSTEIVALIPAMIRSRVECCCALIRNGHLHRARTARCSCVQ